MDTEETNEYNYADVYRTIALNFTDGKRKVLVEYHKGTWLVAVSNELCTYKTLLDLSKPDELKLHEQYVEFAKYQLGIE